MRKSTIDKIMQHLSNLKGLIIDIRAGAMIKELKKKKSGLESDYSYPLFRKEYPNLPNRYTIHDSFIKCWDAIEAKSDDFLDKLRKSSWLNIIDTILSDGSSTLIDYYYLIILFLLNISYII